MIVKFLTKQKFRFDLGQGFLTIINFIFVVIAASDKLTTFTHLSAITMMMILIPLAIVGVWLCGFILDKLKYYQAYQGEMNSRNEMLIEIVNKNNNNKQQ